MHKDVERILFTEEEIALRIDQLGKQMQRFFSPISFEKSICLSNSISSACQAMEMNQFRRAKFKFVKILDSIFTIAKY